jgi:DNA-binding NarL/FixJ family response regulator
VEWDCDGSNLLINIRDDGPGALTPETPSVSQLAARVQAINGTLQIEATPGWGSEMSVGLPLDAPAATVTAAAAWGLSPREQGVLALVASGARNRAIAETLSISENTVKFHVANLLRKVGASTRAELAALAR